VFTSPLGSKNGILSTFSTLYWRRASAKELALDGVVPFGRVRPLTAAAAEAAEELLIRTRSAQDFGVTFGGGDVAASSCWASEEAVAAAGCSTTSAVDVSNAAGSGVFSAWGEATDFALATGIFGIAGTIGTAVRVSFLA